MNFPRRFNTRKELNDFFAKEASDIKAACADKIKKHPYLYWLFEHPEISRLIVITGCTFTILGFGYFAFYIACWMPSVTFYNIYSNPLLIFSLLFGIIGSFSWVTTNSAQLLFARTPTTNGITLYESMKFYIGDMVIKRPQNKWQPSECAFVVEDFDDVNEMLKLNNGDIVRMKDYILKNPELP